jgi:8-oxo-dGTP pyrophosphatase MutT (NUDIX family)
MKNKKTAILNADKPYKYKKWLKGTDKITPTGPILGASDKWPHPLDKKFMGCSKYQSNKNMVSEDLAYNEFTNSNKAVEKKCPVCGIKFKNVHSSSQKYCSKPCELQGKTKNRLQEAFNKWNVQKAGVIPYFIDNLKQIHMLFVKSSDANYGGDKFMIAKGHVDPGENLKTTAFREAHEECGLKLSNVYSNSILVGWRGEITGLSETSEMTIFVARVINPVEFDKFGYETAETKWLTPEEFYSIGRQSHKTIVKSCVAKIRI